MRATRRIVIILLLLAAGTGLAARSVGVGSDRQDNRAHIAWVADVMKRLETIKPGMTRGQLLKVFTTEGGLGTELDQTYAARDCPYFHVTVEFRVVGRPERDANGRVPLILDGSDGQDVIVKITRPFLSGPFE
jgi:hypothetical protein